MTKIEELLAELCPNGVVWKELGEVCVVNKGKQLNKTLLTDDGRYPAYNGGKTYSGRTSDYNVEENTIIISQGGASAGFVNFVTTKFWANAHCYYLLPDLKLVDNRYLYHFLKMKQSYLMDFQHGAGIPALKSDKITKMVLPLPPLEIQQEIVALLDKFTDYVTELTAELTDRQKQYSFYRDKLLSFEDEVYQVEWKTLGEVALVTKLAGYEFTKYVQYSNKGNIIALRGLNIKKGKLILDDVKYIDNSDFSKLNRSKLQKDDLLFTYVGTVGEVALVDENNRYYLAPNVAMVRNHSKLLNPRYLMYYFQSCAFVFKQIDKYMESSSMKNLTMEKIRQFKIPVPSLEIQSRIVQVLDNFDAVCNDLNIGLPKEIELRQKQYEYFREKLLTFTAEGVYPGQWTVDSERGLSDLIRLLQWVFGPIRVQLGAVSSYSSKKVSTSILTVENYVGVDNLLQNKSGKVDATYLPTQQNVNEYQIEDILVGNIRPYLKKIWFATNNGGASPDVLVFQNQTESCLSNRFLYHVLASDNFFEYDLKNSKGSKMPRGDKNAILQYRFILPSLSDQSRIVSILDTFDTLTNSIAEGLPKEIELRQKQYEYFRDKLLSF